MNKEQQVFANAWAQAHEAHERGSKYSVLTTEQTCPSCGKGKLIAEVLATDPECLNTETDVACPICKKKMVFHS